MKKFFTLFAAALLCGAPASAAMFTFNSPDDVSQTFDGYTVSIQKGKGNNDPAVYNDHLRLYASNTITVTGDDLTDIRISFSKQGNKEYATLDASTGTLTSGGVSISNEDLVVDTWTGSASSVTFTLGGSGQRIIYQLVVNGEEGETPGTGEPDDPDNPGIGDTPGSNVVSLTFDSAEAVYESEIEEYYGIPNYSVFLFDAASPELPYFALDLYPDTQELTPGVYDWDTYYLGDWTYYVFGYGDDDITWATGGSVSLVKNGNVWTITGTIPCDDNKTYKISFTGEMPVYLDKDYYGDGDDDGDGSAVGSVEADTDADLPSFDLLGRKVSKDFRGIVIRGGKKFVNF